MMSQMPSLLLLQLQMLKGVEPAEITIIERYATGGTGDLWLASHPSVSSPFLLKYAQDEAGSNPYILGQFEREYEVSRRLAAKNEYGCSVYIADMGRDDLDHPYLLMEFFPSESLDSVMKTCFLWRDVQKILREFCIRLDRIHELGIVHRDIKPGNILVNAKGDIRIIDFSLSTIDGQWHRYHHEGTAIGTPLYMPPEQAFGVKELLTPAADWYSTGVILFEWLTGYMPFCGKTPGDTLKMHCYEPAPFPSNRNLPSAPDDLCRICAELLVKTSDERQTGIRHLRELLGIESSAHSD